MSVIIRRDRRRKRRVLGFSGLGWGVVALCGLAAGLGGVTGIAWRKGGQQPLHSISQSLPAPRFAVSGEASFAASAPERQP